MKISINFYLMFFVVSFLHQQTDAQMMNAFRMGAPIQGDLSTDNFGESVAMNFDGTIMATGTPEDSTVPSSAGVVRVYQWNNGWTQLGADLVGEAYEDFSATSISLDSSGYRLAIVAKYNDGNFAPGTETGQLRVYEWSGTAWLQMGSDIDGAPQQQLGQDVALSGDGNRVAVSTEERYNPNVQGKVQVFTWNGTGWIPMGNDLVGGYYSRFGHSLDISNDGMVLAIGNPWNSQQYSADGEVTVYEWNGLDWISRDSLNGAGQSNYFGNSVSLNNDGTVLIAGAHGFSDNCNFCGEVRVFQWNGISYQLKGQPINGSGPYSEIGWKVSTSNDGNRIIFSGSEDGILSPEGETLVYVFDGINWVKLTQDITNLKFIADASFEIDMSGDGKRFVLGHASTFQYNTDTGIVRIFQMDPGIPCQNNIVLSGSPLLQPAVESMDWIQTSGTVIVPVGNDVRLDADTGAYVKLNPGFLARYGSTFVAKPYNGCQPGTPSRPGFDDGAVKDVTVMKVNELSVYPNPSHGVFTLNTPGELKVVRVMDAQGRVLKTVSFAAGTLKEIDLGMFRDGMYILQADNYKPVKVIKN